MGIYQVQQAHMTTLAAAQPVQHWAPLPVDLLEVAEQSSQGDDPSSHNGPPYPKALGSSLASSTSHISPSE